MNHEGVSGEREIRVDLDYDPPECSLNIAAEGCVVLMRMLAVSNPAGYEATLEYLCKRTMDGWEFKKDE